MNSKKSQLYAVRNAPGGDAGVSQAETDASNECAGIARPLEARAAAGRTGKPPGKRGAANAEDAKDGADAEEPKCEVFSAIDILVRHLTRNGDGAPPPSGEWKEMFLDALARAPIVTVAARIAGVSRKRALEARMADAEFARQWDDALEQGVDEIEAAAFRSAVFGEEKPVYHQGQVKGWTVEYSHAMRSMLLKSRRPEIYGDKEEDRGPVTLPMTLEEFRKRVEEARKE
jgi:hypothetical protein